MFLSLFLKETRPEKNAIEGNKNDLSAIFLTFLLLWTIKYLACQYIVHLCAFEIEDF